jgi:hypothetical protein
MRAGRPYQEPRQSRRQFHEQTFAKRMRLLNRYYGS